MVAGVGRPAHVQQRECFPDRLGRPPVPHVHPAVRRAPVMLLRLLHHSKQRPVGRGGGQQTGLQADDSRGVHSDDGVVGDGDRMVTEPAVGHER